MRITQINISLTNRVKSGNFGHQVNSDIHLQTVEIQMRRLLMGRLMRIFTVFLVVNIFIQIMRPPGGLCSLDY